MSSLEENQEIRCCPQCGAETAVAQLEEVQYRCPECDTELAHLDISPSGSVRRVLGWLKSVDDVIGGRYRVKTVLGRGGFAATYLVEDLTLNGRRRALKEIPESLFDEHELHFLSRIDHPAVPDITDRLKADGMEYLVLKFGGSRTLESERRRRNGQIPFDDHLRDWMLQLCKALEHLHSLDPPIIHRDLKPANILLDDNDRVMLIDFGIAKESNRSTKTRAAGCATSHGFSSPEQEMDMGTDQRSDIYSFGATMYALLTGLTPPAASDRLLQGKPVLPPSQFASNIPPALEKTILRALDINPEHRQQTIGELAIVLEGLEASDSKRISQRTVFLDTPGVDTHTTNSKLESVKLPRHTAAGRQAISDPATGGTDQTSIVGESNYTEPRSTPSGRTEPSVSGRVHFGQIRTKRPLLMITAIVLAVLAAAIGWYFISSEPATESPTVRLAADPDQGEAPLDVSFDGSASSDPDGRITAYRWDFGDGASDSGVQTRHTYKTADKYTATLTVTDDAGASSSDSVTITVNQRSPQAVGGKNESTETAVTGTAENALNDRRKKPEQEERERQEKKAIPEEKKEAKSSSGSRKESKRSSGTRKESKRSSGTRKEAKSSSGRTRTERAKEAAKGINSTWNN